MRAAGGGVPESCGRACAVRSVHFRARHPKTRLPPGWSPVPLRVPFCATAALLFGRSRRVHHCRVRFLRLLRRSARCQRSLQPKSLTVASHGVSRRARAFMGLRASLVLLAETLCGLCAGDRREW